MRTRSWLATVVLLAPFVGTAIAAVAQSQDKPAQDSLAEAARKAREAKKAQAKPAKVITNEDIAKKAGPTPAGGSAEGGQGETPDKNKEAAPAAAKDEAYWRARFKEARENLARAEKELDILERELQKANTQYYSDPQKAMNEQFNRKEINDKTAAIEAKKKEVAGLRQSISDMEDELRQSGGEPGWAR
jgi:chromosome segregation ATPase